MNEVNNMNKTTSRGLCSLLSLALSAATLFGGAPALAEAPSGEAVLSVEATAEAPDVGAAGAQVEPDATGEPESTGEPGMTAVPDATAAPSEAPTEAPALASAEQRAIQATFEYSSGQRYQLIKTGNDYTHLTIVNRGDAIPDGAYIEVVCTGLEFDDNQLRVSDDQTAEFSVKSYMEGVFTLKVRVMDAALHEEICSDTLMLICVDDARDFAIPIICSDLSGSGIKKVDYVFADDPTTRLEVNSELMPAGYSASWSISTTTGEGNATIKLSGSGGAQTPPILYTKSNVANVSATITLTVTLPGGEKLTRRIPVSYEVREKVPTGFKTTGDLLVVRLGELAQVDLTTAEEGSALTNGMSVTASLVGDADGQLTTTTFTPDDGLSIGATKPGVYDVVITAVSDVPGVVDGATFTKNVQLIVADASAQLPEGLFKVDPAELEATVYDDSASLGTVTVKPCAPLPDDVAYKVSWLVLAPDGSVASIGCDSADGDGHTATLRPASTLESGVYQVQATVTLKSATAKIYSTLRLYTSEPRIDGLRSSYQVPWQYSSYVISAPGVVVLTSEGEWEEYAGNISWSCEPVDSASDAAFESVTIDAGTGYTVFKLPATRVTGTFRYKFTATLADGRTATQTVALGVEDASGVVPTPMPTLDPTQPRTGKVNASRVNVRSGPSTDSAILGQVKRGDKLTVNDWTQEWFSFTFEGRTAYIKGEYVTLDAVELPTAAPTATPAPTETPASTATPAPAARKGKVNANRVNVRSGPGTSYAALGQVTLGDELEIEDWSQQWYKFTYNGQTAYIMGQYVTLDAQPTAAPTATPTPTAAPATRRGEVNADRVNVRSGPGTTYSVLGQLTRGDALVIDDWSQSWYKFLYNGQTAYIMGQYVTLDAQPTATPAPTPTSSAGATQYGRVTVGTSLNMRAEPNASSAVVAKLLNSTYVEILGQTGSWYYVQHNGVKGYVSRQYIQLAELPTATTTPTPSPAPRVGTVTLSNSSSRLIMRSGPGTSYSEITRLANGTKVTVMLEDQGFYYIEYEGRQGYVAKQYIVLGGTASPTATPRPTNKPTSTPRPTATASANYATVIKSDGLALHETEQGATVRTIPNYGVVEVLHVYGDWTHVSYEGTVGYVESKYLKSGIVKPEGSSGTSAQVTLANSAAMYLRSAPNQSSQALTMIPNGATVTVITTGDTWCKISYNGKTGYCMAKYLKLLG